MSLPAASRSAMPGRAVSSPLARLVPRPDDAPEVFDLVDRRARARVLGNCRADHPRVVRDDRQARRSLSEIVVQDSPWGREPHPRRGGAERETRGPRGKDAASDG
jgi:hypothetical protein